MTLRKLLVGKKNVLELSHIKIYPEFYKFAKNY